jgi:outer membrane protein insertion porin family
MPGAMSLRVSHANRALAFICLLLALAIGTAAWPQAGAPTIAEIRIRGNQRVDDDAIRIQITSHVGEPFDRGTVDRDVKAIYRMGFFKKVTAHIERSGGQVILTFTVEERPLVSQVNFEGMTAFKPTDEKVRGALKIQARSILDPIHVLETIKGLEGIYREKGYLDVAVNYKTTPQPNNEVILVFQIKEGPLVHIGAIKFVGNHAFKAKQLRNLVETRPYNLIFSLLFNTGVLNRKVLAADVDRLKTFYYQHGYLNAQVFDPTVTRKGNSLIITFKINEGEPYRIGAITFEGDLKVPVQELRKRLTLKPGQPFQGLKLQHDVLTLSDFYTDRGYAFANVDPRTQVDPLNHLINVNIRVTPGEKILVDRITISGNVRTRDYVIRRQMAIEEQEPYSATKIRASKARLDRLGLFSQTQISTTPGREPDQVDLNVGVKEAQTGTFSLGGGIDTVDGAFGNASIGERNLFGTGNSATFSALFGFLFRNIDLNFTDPYFLDMPLTFAIDLFDTEYFLFGFTQVDYGIGFHTLYPLSELGFTELGPFSLSSISLGMGYKFHQMGITDIGPYEPVAITRYHGYYWVSEVMPTLQRMTVDNPADPRRGSSQSATVEFAGLGGNSYFIKALLHSRWFFPIIDSSWLGQWVYSLGVDYGIGTSLQPAPGADLPLYERFFPGGIDSVRGYEFFSLGPNVALFNNQGQPIGYTQIGGSKELLLSTEITFPIWESIGLRGVVFVDAGNAYLLHQAITLPSLAAAWGLGIRWRSPFGPIRLEYAVPINPKPGYVIDNFVFGGGSPL